MFKLNQFIEKEIIDEVGQCAEPETLLPILHE